MVSVPTHTAEGEYGRDCLEYTSVFGAKQRDQCGLPMSESVPSVALSVTIRPSKQDNAAYILSTISGILLALSANVSDSTILSSSLFSDAFSMAKRKDIIRIAVELSLLDMGPRQLSHWLSFVIGSYSRDL
jgi:hypothetical protein